MRDGGSVCSVEPEGEEDRREGGEMLSSFRLLWRNNLWPLVWWKYHRASS